MGHIDFEFGRFLLEARVISHFDLLRRHGLAEESLAVLVNVLLGPSVELCEKLDNFIGGLKIDSHASGLLVLVEIARRPETLGGCIELDVVSLLSVEEGGGFIAAAIDDNRRDVELVRHC